MIELVLVVIPVRYKPCIFSVLETVLLKIKCILCVIVLIIIVLLLHYYYFTIYHVVLNQPSICSFTIYYYLLAYRLVQYLDVLLLIQSLWPILQKRIQLDVRLLN